MGWSKIKWKTLEMVANWLLQGLTGPEGVGCEDHGVKLWPALEGLHCCDLGLKYGEEGA